MSLYAKAGMVVVYILLFSGSVLLGYYLIGIVKNRCGSKGKGRIAR